ncbi:MerR family transcriptional regulator [Acidobacteriota bacterium]
MKKTIYSQADFVMQVGITDKVLDEWIKVKLLKPDGFADDKTPFFTSVSLDKAIHLQRLLELGYKPEDIHKIIRKVGLPRHKADAEKDSKVREYLTVGDLAERVGVSPRAIKHWEEKGIIEPDMRSEGGFRLYADVYVYFCELIKDLQLFSYSLEAIKEISDHFRVFLAVKNNLETYAKEETEAKLEEMLERIRVFDEKTGQLKRGIERWEDLLKKKKREIGNLRARNRKRGNPQVKRGEKK